MTDEFPGLASSVARGAARMQAVAITPFGVIDGGRHSDRFDDTLTRIVWWADSMRKFGSASSAFPILVQGLFGRFRHMAKWTEIHR